jgi:hypothetical protein
VIVTLVTSEVRLRYRRANNRRAKRNGNIGEATVKKNPVAKDLRTPKYRQRKVESKKKYNRKREVVGYYMDYDGKERILYKDDRD